MKIKVTIVDCQKIFVEGLQLLFAQAGGSYQIMHSICGVDELFPTLDQGHTDILLMELNLLHLDGLPMIERIRERYADIKIVVLSSYRDSRRVRTAMVNGADAYVSKYHDSGELINALEAVMREETYLAHGLRTSPDLRKDSKPEASKVSSMDSYQIKNKLTDREQQILKLITRGMNNRKIGEKLYISHQTVGAHRKNIMKKLEVHNTVSLLKFALEYDLV